MWLARLICNIFSFSDVVVPCFMRLRGLLLQRCCCRRTSVDELGCAAASGFWAVLGFGLPIKQTTTETGDPISAPLSGCKFCPIRLLIWYPASRGLQEFMVMDLHVACCSSVPPQTSRPRSGSLRTSGLQGCHFSPTSSCVSRLLDCKGEHA